MDKFECIKKVQQQFPKAEGVTYSKNGRGNKCYVEHKWTHASGSPQSQRNWQTCRIGKLTDLFCLIFSPRTSNFLIYSQEGGACVVARQFVAS